MLRHPPKNASTRTSKSLPKWAIRPPKSPAPSSATTAATSSRPAYGIEVFNDIDGVSYLPSGRISDSSTLNWKVFSQNAVTTNCEVAYRTTGFWWKSDYSIILNGVETKADVGGWVTINNNSGKRYKNAKLKLIAGDVNTVSNYPNPVPAPMAMAANAVPSAPPSFS